MQNAEPPRRCLRRAQGVRIHHPAFCILHSAFLILHSSSLSCRAGGVAVRWPVGKLRTMNTIKAYPTRSNHITWARRLVAFCTLTAVTCLTVAQETWPPAPPIAPVLAVEDMAPLPSSVSAVPRGQGTWLCTFSFRPKGEVQQVILTGSFNSWDRLANPMRGPDETGAWSAEVELQTGVHEYKFCRGRQMA